MSEQFLDSAQINSTHDPLRRPEMTEVMKANPFQLGLLAPVDCPSFWPARVLVHKTSYFNEAEIQGCRQAALSERVEVLDLVSVRRSGTRLLRAAVPSVVRGTALTFDHRSGIVYLKGTVPCFRTYPGMYIPRALEFTLDDGETAPIELAKKLLDLSKLNFNNTQFDSGDPITVRAARRVGDILKHVPGDRAIQSWFRFFRSSSGLAAYFLGIRRLRPSPFPFASIR